MYYHPKWANRFQLCSLQVKPSDGETSKLYWAAEIWEVKQRKLLTEKLLEITSNVSGQKHIMNIFVKSYFNFHCLPFSFYLVFKALLSKDFFGNWQDLWNISVICITNSGLSTKCFKDLKGQIILNCSVSWNTRGHRKRNARVLKNRVKKRIMKSKIFAAEDGNGSGLPSQQTERSQGENKKDFENLNLLAILKPLHYRLRWSIG